MCSKLPTPNTRHNGTEERADTMTERLIDIVKEAGVEDLPTRQRAKFAQAVKAEREGDNERAALKLDEAVALDR